MIVMTVTTKRSFSMFVSLSKVESSLVLSIFVCTRNIDCLKSRYKTVGFKLIGNIDKKISYNRVALSPITVYVNDSTLGNLENVCIRLVWYVYKMCIMSMFKYSACDIC